MILVFTDTQVYHDEWESNPKRIHQSIVISWGSAYRPRLNYQFYNSFNLIQPYMDDDVYQQYLDTDIIFKYERAMLAFVLTCGIDIVFLTNENYHLYERLYDLLYHMKKVYGITSVYIKAVEDIPEVARDCFYFNITAQKALEEDWGTIIQYLKENPAVQKEFEERLRNSENCL